jgi:hypothetical protein
VSRVARYESLVKAFRLFGEGNTSGALSGTSGAIQTIVGDQEMGNGLHYMSARTEKLYGA